MRDAYDVIVIGSGAGGAPIAHELARAGGRSVLVLEKGPRFEPQASAPRGLSDFKRDELYATGQEKLIRVPGVSNFGRPYFTSHVEPDVNDEPHVYRDSDGSDKATLEGYTAQVVGGGTQLYGGVSLRFAPVDFRLASFNDGRSDLRGDPAGDVRREARDWPVDYAALEPYYAKAERLVGINGTAPGQKKPFTSGDHYQAPLPPNPISGCVKRGLDGLGLESYRTPLAVITEDHAPSGRKAGDPKTGYVNRYGDPLGLKSNVYVSLLRPVLGGPDIDLACNCVVTHLESDGPRVRRVWYRDPAGRPRSVVANRAVVVACSAIESVRLLLLSARQSSDFDARMFPQKSGGGRKDLLGRYFLTHCFGGASALVPGSERADKSLSVDSDWATDHCATEAFARGAGLWAGGAIYNNTSAQALPLSLLRSYGDQDIDTIWMGIAGDPGLVGDRLVRDVFDGEFGRKASVSFMANQVPLPSNRIELHPRITDKWGRPAAYITKNWHSHDVALMDTLAGVCRAILEKGLEGSSGGGRVLGSGGVYLGPNGIIRIANHILGGARFGTDRDDSVLDPQCRVWDFDNLYVTDGSFMPTSGSANPTLTIQANAFRVADHLLATL